MTRPLREFEPRTTIRKRIGITKPALEAAIAAGKVRVMACGRSERVSTADTMALAAPKEKPRQKTRKELRDELYAEIA